MLISFFIQVVKKGMEYATGSLAYALSNPSILLCSCLKASLDVFLIFFE